jgi:hypothetical protein
MGRAMDPTVGRVPFYKVGVKACAKLTVTSGRLFRALRLAMVRIHVGSSEEMLKINGASILAEPHLAN